jgi:hypothetical protein
MPRSTVTGLSAQAIEAELDGTSRGNPAAAGLSAGWAIWPGPRRGYIVLENDLLLIADALEALWFLRAQQRQMEIFLAGRGIVLLTRRRASGTAGRHGVCGRWPRSWCGMLWTTGPSNLQATPHHMG